MQLTNLAPVAILLVLAFVQAASAQGVPSLQDFRKRTDATMERVGKGDIEGGLRSIRPLSVVPQAEFDAMLGQASLQLPLIKARFGESLGYEFIKEEVLGSSLARITYIHKFERHAMRWIFYAYKGKSGWVVNTFRFDDKWHELFSGQ